ncbi:MAG: amidohydrolase family protein [Gemmatimonadales bacterium]
MLIDVHAHFFTELSSRADWREVNQARLDAGDKIGITAHVASILGTWGMRSPTYFPSHDDVVDANQRMLELQQTDERIFGYCVVNPNYTDLALEEIESCIGDGMVGVKLAASRRASDRLLDPVIELAATLGVPVLHHIWQHRRRDWPGQEASDAVELAALAGRHPDARLILAHLGGGGDWSHSLRAIRDVSNVWVDLSGSGVDVDMLDCALTELGPERLLWGCDVTMDTGWGKLRYLESLGLSSADLDFIRYRNARSIFPEGAFGAGH